MTNVSMRLLQTALTQHPSAAARLDKTNLPSARYFSRGRVQTKGTGFAQNLPARWTLLTQHRNRHISRMAAPQGVGSASDATAYILEECEVYFLYRPVPGKERIRDESDVAEFYIVQCPKRQGGKCRLLMTAKHRLPDVNRPGEERTLGLVVRVADTKDQIFKALDEYDFTNTPVMEAGRGLSALVGKGLPETYLFMEVLEPPQPGPEQQALALCQIDSKCSCFKIVVRNPFAPSSRSIGSHGPPDFVTKDPDKIKMFGNQRWASVQDPSLLDYERVEFQLFPVKRKPTGDLQAAIMKHLEAVARNEDFGGGAPHDDHEEDNNASFSRLSRWLR